MRASIGTILETGHGERLILGLLEECTRVAGAEWFAPDPEHMVWYRKELTQTGSPSTASMLRDINRGHPTEAAHILGDMVARGVRRGVPTPLLEIVLTHLQAYELSRV